MGDINETISVNAAPGIAGLKEFTAALEQASGKWAAFEDKTRGGLGGGGADKLAAGMDKAAASISAAADKIAASLNRVGQMGASAGKAASQLAAIGDAGKSAAGGVDSLGASASGAAGKLKGLGDAGVTAGDGLKGVGDGAKASEAFLAEFNATMAETAALEREVAAASADASAKIAASQRLNTVAARNASRDAVAAQRAQSSAAKQAVVDAEASQRRYQNLMLGGAALAGYGIYKAGQLQAGVTRLFTTAGESKANLPMITAAIPKLAGQTATSQQELLQGAYMIESAGFHGKAGLSVLKAAAQGAYAEGAPLGETGNALTSMMNAYRMRPGQAMSAMNQIIAMVSQGKMTMSGAVSALPTMLPAAASAHLSFAQAGGALASMTALGMSPDQAAQNIRHVITSLQKPSNIASAEMQMLGINPVQLSKNLGKQGLTGTISEVGAAIQKHIGKDGLVMLDVMNRAKLATQSANAEIAAMPPALQGVAKAYLSGAISAKAWSKELHSAGVSARDANLLKQFGSTAGSALGFSQMIKSGLGNRQTVAGALKAAMGDQTGMQVAQILGPNMGAFRARAADIAKAQAAGTNVAGWDQIQKTFNFQLKSFEQNAQAALTTMGTALLPAATGAMHFLAGAGSFLSGHPGLTKGLAFGGGALGAGYLLQRLRSPVTMGLQGVGKVAEVLKIPGLDKLAHIGGSAGSAGAAAGMDRVAAAGTAAAAALDRVAAAGDVAAGGESAAGKAGYTAAAGEEAAGVGGSAAGKVLGGLGTALAGLMISKPIIDALENKKHPNVLGNTSPNSPWNSFDSNRSLGGKVVRFLKQGPDVAPYRPSSPAFWKAGPGYAPAPASNNVAWLSARIPHIDTSQIGLRGLREGAKLPAPQVAKPKVPAPDLTSFNAALASAMHKPVKLAPPDLSALSGAKGKAQSDAKAITTAMETSLHKPVKATKPDLSSYTAAAGAARADGAAISAGLAGGILAGEGAVVAAAGQVASAAAAAMASAVKARSPSRVTHKIGEDTATGFEHGLRSKTHAVKAASAALSASAVTSLTQGLQGGKSAVDAALQAITGKGARPQDLTTIMNTISTLKGDVSRAVSKGVIGQVEGSKLSVLLDLDNHRLQGLATRRARLIQEITDAQQIAQGVISGASIMGAGGYTPSLAASSGPLSAYATVSGMQAQAADQTTFAQQVKQLRKMGLNSTSLDQIIQAGAQQGLPIAEGLTQGGAGQIKQLNQAEKQIHAAASSIGDTGGQAMYEAGQQAGQGIAEGLKSQLSAVDAAMKDIAQHMMGTLEHALAGHAAGKTRHGKAAAHAAVHAVAGAASSAASSAGGTGTLHVPSLGGLAQMAHSAATALGRDATAGGRAAAALDHLASAAGRAGHHHGGHHGGGGGGGNVTYVTNVHVTVQGSVTSEGDLLTKLQTMQLKRANNNWQGGWRLPGRAN